MSDEPRAHFGEYAPDYRRFRPDYPGELFERIAALAPATRTVWECGAGSGQATAGLAGCFERVIASDVSRAQIAAGAEIPNVWRLVAAAERAPLAPDSADAVAVAQALHWFDPEPFFAEVARVAAGGVLAAWSYDGVTAGPTVDPVVRRLHREIVGPWWLPQRRHVESAYASIETPWPALDVWRSRLEKRWTWPEFSGYLMTWSAVRRFREGEGRDPVSLVREELEAAWQRDAGSLQVRLPVAWRLTLRVFGVPG